MLTFLEVRMLRVDVVLLDANELLHKALGFLLLFVEVRADHQRDCLLQVREGLKALLKRLSSTSIQGIKLAGSRRIVRANGSEASYLLNY